MTDRACPLAFLVATAFVSALVWVYAMLTQVPLP
jgi:hypothetical protein